MQATPIVDQLTEKHYRAIADIVRSSVGIQLPATKRTMVEGRLRKRVRILGLKDLVEYGRFLFEQDGLEAELVHLIDCVTTNKTDFFREPAHFEFLRSKAVPALLRLQQRRPASLKIWSAASSSGAEAYTIAMVLEDMVREGSEMRYAILGTDVSTDILQAARSAVYPREFVEPVPATMRQRYIMVAKDARADTVKIAPELRRRVQFQHLNLMDQSYPVDRDVDVIFCRNVLIYFDKPTQNAVIERLVSHLRPGGYLMLGHSESMAGAGVAGIDQIAATIFQSVRPALRKSVA